MRAPLLLTALGALLLAGCGEAETQGHPAATAPTSESTPAAETPSAPKPPMPPPPPERSGSLKPRAGDTPLEVGTVAPAFEARPEGKALIVFYRGHW